MLSRARHLVVLMRRPEGQSQFNTTLESQHVDDDAIRELVSWASDNLGADLSVVSMRRSFHRVVEVAPSRYRRGFTATG